MAESLLQAVASPLPTSDEMVEHLSEIEYVPYESELQLPEIMRLMKADLSEPYSVYTYRYFIHNWPKLCLMVCLVMINFQSAQRILVNNILV